MSSSEKSSNCLWPMPRRVFNGTFLTILGLYGSITHAVITGDGKTAFTDLLVTSTEGFWDDWQAERVADWLNGLDGSLYSVSLSDGTSRFVGDTNAINPWLVSGRDEGYRLSRIGGPSSFWGFGEEGQMGCVGGANTQPPTDAVGSLSACLGSTLETVVQIATVSNTFNRPTSQFQRDIRRFASRSLNQASTGGGSASDNYLFEGKIGTYFAGGGSFGNFDATKTNSAFGVYNQTGTGAMDYRFTDWAVAGFMFNYTGTQSIIALSSGHVDDNAYRFMPFASFIPFDNAYIDVMAGYGYQSYNSFQGGASGVYSSDQALASMDLGYTYSIEEFDLTGFAGGSYIGTNVSGYTSSDLTKVNPYSVTSWTSTLGGQLAYNYSTTFGVIQPLLRLEWVHGYNDAGKVVITSAAGGISQLPSALGINDWGNITAGVQTVLPQGMMAFLNYQGQVMQGGQNNGVLGGVRLEF